MSHSSGHAQRAHASGDTALAAPAPQLLIGRSGSADEHAADAMADAVVGQSSPLTSKAGCSCGKSAAPCEACGRGIKVQRSSAGSAPAGIAPPSVHQAISQPGRPLAGSRRAAMESRFGEGFGDVRLHTDSQAHESARAIGARAYTVGSHIAFARGTYSDSVSSDRLLAHELAHVVQQRGSGSQLVQRDDGVPSPDAAPAAAASEAAQADTAEAFCDVSEMCTLRFAAPTVMTPDRLSTALRRCRPGILLTSNPCLQPEIALSPPTAPLGPGVGPRRAPGTTLPSTPAPGPAPPSSGLDLSALTTFDFSLGPADFHVSLPSSARVTLPVEIRGATRIVFKLDASTSGSFKFTATLDGIPHISIAASAGVDVANERASAGLTFTTTRKVCQVASPAATKEKITKAGEKLEKAITALQQPPTGEGDVTMERASTLADVASSIADMYKAVEAAEGPCKDVPVFQLGLGAHTDFGQPDPGDEGNQPSSFLGATATFRF